MARGTVVKFDPIKGYGFIETESAGQDFFLHVNDLLEDKALIRAGAVVDFVPERGERGMKATSVRLVPRPVAPGELAPDLAPHGDRTGPRADDADDLADVLSPAEYQQEVTDLLLRIEPALLAPQILAIRERLVALSDRHGWLGD